MTSNPLGDGSTLRSQMPVTKRWAFFDHAAVAPIPTCGHQAMNEWTTDIMENGGVHHGDWMNRIEKVRQTAGRLIDADPFEIAFVKNTSEGIGIVAEGFPWRAGDNVVTSAEEYPANVYPWMNLADRGVEVRLVPSRQGRVLIDDLRQAIDPNTRILTISFVEFASGFRNDLAALGTLCRELGVYFFVDAIQGLGMLPLSVDEVPIDFLAADGHKWLLGPGGPASFTSATNCSICSIPSAWAGTALFPAAISPASIFA